MPLLADGLTHVCGVLYDAAAACFSVYLDSAASPVLVVKNVCSCCPSLLNSYLMDVVQASLSLAPSPFLLYLYLSPSTHFFSYITKVMVNDKIGNAQAWIGFTAATGGLNQEHLIHSWSFYSKRKTGALPSAEISTPKFTHLPKVCAIIPDAFDVPTLTNVLAPPIVFIRSISSLIL